MGGTEKACTPNDIIDTLRKKLTSERAWGVLLGVRRAEGFSYLNAGAGADAGAV